MGKILFTDYRNQKCALLLADNRLKAVQMMAENGNRIGAVYIGKIKNVVKNIDACFLEIADGEICFLAMKDATTPILLNRSYDGRLVQGDEILVQITREAQKTKQASVTAHISLSNEYAVISIGSRRVGYSGKLTKVQKEAIKAELTASGYQQGSDFIFNTTQPDLPLGLVVRTKAAETPLPKLMEQIQLLRASMQELLNTAGYRTCFSCIRQAPEDFEAILDQLAYPYEYDEIVTDDSCLYEKLNAYCEEKLLDKAVRLYEETAFPLSKLYSLESKMDTAVNTRVWLKSGGYLIIEHTEALTVIDVNTGKYEAKKTSDRDKLSEETYQRINREAAEEIALQLRLRNLSGIILVDFINMNSREKEEELLTFLREQVRKDKIKTLVIDITPLGLVEITRKKRHKPLREQLKNNGKER